NLAMDETSMPAMSAGVSRNSRADVIIAAPGASSVLPASESVGSRTHPIARIAHTGTNTRNIIRHPNASAMNAPSGAPEAVPAPFATAHHPSALALRAGPAIIGNTYITVGGITDIASP